MQGVDNELQAVVRSGAAGLCRMWHRDVEGPVDLTLGVRGALEVSDGGAVGDENGPTLCQHDGARESGVTDVQTGRVATERGGKGDVLPSTSPSIAC